MLRYTIFLLIYAFIFYKAIKTEDPIDFCLLGLLSLIFGLNYIAVRNPEALWVKCLLRERVRTDTKYMTRQELFSSGGRFLKYALFFFIPLILISYLRLELNFFWGSVFFGVSIFFLSFFGGGLYLLIRGSLRKKDYVPPEERK